MLGSIFRGMGDSKTPLMTVLCACIFNIAGDLFSVAVLHMQAAEAALATILAQAFRVILCIIIVKKRGLPFPFSRNFVMVQGIVGAFLVRIPVSYFFSKIADVTLFQIGLATPASTVVQIILCTLFYLYVFNKEKKQLQ